jgi:hypothetical protein
MQAALKICEQELLYHTPSIVNKIYADDHPQKIIPMKSYDGMHVSEEEYWQKYYDFPDVSLEWNNGILEEKPVSDKESYDLYAWIHRVISQNLHTFKEGSLVGLEIGFRLDVGDNVTIRKPDLAFIHKDNPVQMYPLETTYKGCFDICFEFLSDTTKEAVERDTVVKKHEYEKFGVREYYILDRLGDETAFYYLDSKGLYKPLKPNRNGIVKSKVLKNFQFRVEDLYNRPSDRQLVEDRIYQKYVMIDYQKERKKAVEANKKANAERQKADEAKKRLEAERKKADEANKRVEAERKKADKAEKSLEAERKKADKAKKSLEAERKKADKAEKSLEAERKKADKAEKSLEAERKKTNEAKKSAETERQKVHMLERELQKIKDQLAKK